MARPPRPYEKDGWFVTSYGGIQHQKLCEVAEGRKAAEVALARLMVGRSNAQQERQVAGPGIRLKAAHEERLVADVFNEFMALKKVETDQTTFDYYLEKLTTLYERFGARPIRSVTLQDGLNFKACLMKDKAWKKGKKIMRGLGNCSVNHHIRCARMLFNWAAKPSRRYIDVNPWVEISYLGEKARERLITDDEFQSLVAQATGGSHRGGDKDLVDMLVLLRNTTMRPGELRFLRWEYLQFDRHTAIFPADVIKTRGRRQITMNDSVESMLRARKARVEKARGYVFPGGNRSDVETQIEKKVLSKRFRRLFNRCAKLGLIQDLVSGERLVVYSTRHTRITELVAARLPLKAVMDDAGHVQASTTNRYTHLADAVTTALVREVRGIEPTPPPASDASAKAE